MDKRAIIKQFAVLLAADLAVITQAALATREGAIHAESKAEDQYDTRGLEASYLAGAQSKRAMELEATLNLFRHIDIKDFGPATAIASTALIELECAGHKSYCLMMPKAGGKAVIFAGKSIHCITPQSPLGEAVLGRVMGDEVSLERNGVAKDYVITRVW